MTRRTRRGARSRRPLLPARDGALRHQRSQIENGRSGNFVTLMSCSRAGGCGGERTAEEENPGVAVKLALRLAWRLHPAPWNSARQSALTAGIIELLSSLK